MRGRPPSAGIPAQALGFIYVTGAWLGGTSLLLPHDDRVTVWIPLALAVVATLAGLALLRWPARFEGPWRLHALTVLGTVILTIGVTAAGPGVYGVIFFWTGLYACVFFRGWLAAAHVGLCGAGYATALLLADFGNDTRLGRWYVTIGALAILGAVASWLMRRLAAQRLRIERQTSELRRAEARTRQILETAQDGHLILDSDGVVVDVNAAALALVGRRRVELVGHRFADVALPPHDEPGHEDRRGLLLASGGTTRFETELRHADGSLVPIEISAAVIDVEGDRLVAGFLHPLRERRIAEALQRSLLPETLPRLAGVEIDARYEPAAREADVGGDWYDAIVLREDRLALVMGDVAGKGLRGAAMVGRLRSALRAYVLEHEDPAAVAQRLNRLFASEPSEIEIVTLAIVVLDPSSGEVHYVSAGHPPPLVIEPDAAPWWLDGAPGPPIGAVASPDYRTCRAKVQSGAALVLYTDGLVERPGESLETGFARLAGEAAAAPAAMGALVDTLVAGGRVSDGGHDDVAVLAVRATPLGPRLVLDLPARADSLAAMRATMRRWLNEQSGVSADRSAQVVLAVNEACTNAVEHARGAASSTYRVSAEAVPGGELRIAVRSAGDWRPERTHPEGGRGLDLMRMLIDDVLVETGDGATTVRLTARASG